MSYFLEVCYFRDEKIPGIIHSSDGVRKKRDDRVLDEYEENWFDTEDDELNTTTNSETSMKPLNAKLKDVDLLDNLPSLNRPSSPQKASQNHTKSGPNSPQKNVLSDNARKGSPEVPKCTQKILPDSPRPTSPNSHKNHEEKFLTNKQFPGLNNKPLMSIKINSGILNPPDEEVSASPCKRQRIGST